MIVVLALSLFLSLARYIYIYIYMDCKLGMIIIIQNAFGFVLGSGWKQDYGFVQKQ